MDILNRIEEMGNDPAVTVAQLDEFVDECLAFLRREQVITPDDVFQIEAARQDALINKFSRTVQKP